MNYLQKFTGGGKLCLVLLVMMALLAPARMMGQETITVTIGEGTDTEYFLPCQINYKYSLSEQIYTAGEIGDAGTISSIAFYNTSAARTRTLDIYMVHTDLAQFSSLSDRITVSTNDKVFSGSVTLSPDQWSTIDLTSPFQYDGTSNLVVVVDDNTGSYVYGASTYFKAFSSSHSALCSYSDNTNFDPLSTTYYDGQNLNVKNQIQLVLSLTSTPNPKNLTVSGVDPRNATVSWTAPAENLTYQCQYKTGAGEWTDLPSTNNTSVTLANLTPDSDYTFRVKAIYADGESVFAYTTFHTEISCFAPTKLRGTLTPGDGTVASLSWTDEVAPEWVLEYSTASDFTGATQVSVYNTPVTGLTGLTPETKYYARVKAICDVGDESLWSNVYSFTPTNDYILTLHEGDGTEYGSNTPIWGGNISRYQKHEMLYTADELTLVNGNIRSLKFYTTSIVNKTYGSAQFTVFLKEVEEGNGFFYGTAYYGYNYNEIVYQGRLSVTNGVMEIVFSQPYAYHGGNLLVGIYLTTTFGTNYSVYTEWTGETLENNRSAYGDYYQMNNMGCTLTKFLPKTSFEFVPENPYCLRPNDEQVSNVDYHTATMSWTPQDGQDNWEIYYTTDLADEPGDEPTGSGFISNIGTTSYDLTGLTPNTTYYIYVRSNCGGGEKSIWTVRKTFKTKEFKAPTNLYVNEQTITARTADISWDAPSEGDPNAYELYLKGPDDDDPTDSTEPTCAGITTLNYTVTGLTPETEYYVYVRANYGNGDYSIWASGYYSYFMTEEACKAPSESLLTMQVTATTAQLAWVPENGESRWRLVYGHYVDGELFIDQDDQNLSTPHKTLTGLTEGTEYFYSVYAYCGVEDGWSNPMEGYFVTMDCTEDELCAITYDLNKPMQWGYWRVAVVDVQTGEYVALIAPRGSSVSGGELKLCPEKMYSFYAQYPYKKGMEKGDEEGLRDASDFFVFYEHNGDKMFSLDTWPYSSNYSLLNAYEMNCSECGKPQNLTVNASMEDASVTWQPSGAETSWKVNYRAFGSQTYDFEDGLFPAGWYDFYNYSLGDNNIVEIDGNHCLSTGGAYSSYPAIPMTSFTGELSFKIKGNSSRYFYVFLISSNGETTQIYGGQATTEFVTHTIQLDEWSEYNGVGVYFYLYNMMLDDVVVPGFGPWPENVGTVTSTTWSISDLTPGNTYQVSVQAVCGDELSSRALATFTTPLCDGCSISYALVDSYGDGWNGNAIIVLDDDDNIMATLTIEDGTSNNGTLSLCAGTYRFVWGSGYYPDECSYTIYGPDGNVGFQGNGAFSEPFEYVLDCDVSCFAPKDLDVAAGMTSATVTWTPGGEETAWKVQYDVLFGDVMVDFEDLEEVPEDWYWDKSDDTEGGYSIVTETDNKYLQLTINLSNAEYPYAEFDIPVVLGGGYSFKAKAVGSEPVAIAYGWYSLNSDDNLYEEAEVWTAGYQTITISSEGYSGNGVFWFEIRQVGSVAIDDVAFVELNADWHNEAVTVNNTPAYTINGLESNTAYKVRVKAMCGVDDESGWKETTFTTLQAPDKIFDNNEGQGNGEWDTATNWNPEGEPDEEDVVLINAAATIPPDCVAEAANITIGTGGSLTIEDGGQLIHGNAGVQATVKKTISAYNPNATTTDGWYLIGSPLATNVAPANVTNMVASPEENYDLFMFNQFASGSEWQNFKQNHPDFTSLDPKVGYLYANAGNNGQAVTLQFNGTINPMPKEDTDEIGEDDVIALYKGYGAFASWNLVGNPHVCAVYPIYGNFDGSDNYEYWWDGGDAPFYRMNPDTHADLIAVGSGSIMPGEGVFMQNDSYGTRFVRFSTEPYEGGIGGGEMPLDKGGVTLNLTKDRGAAIDRAIVRFGEGPTLGKLMLNPDNTNICFPQGTEDYAIVRSAYEGEAPVNFKAAKNGNYTLNVNVNDAEMEYLHLVDNLTGADVDLLESPAYTFDAKTTDYASRFKLVFKAMEDGPSTGSGTFAYYNGSTWTVSNLGEATLQVIDAMGRILSSETIHGNAEANIQAAPGVYMLRLVNGDHVKVQKIIIK